MRYSDAVAFVVVVVIAAAHICGCSWASCVYDVVDDYERNERKNKKKYGKKIIKRHKSRAAAGAATTNLVNEMEKKNTKQNEEIFRTNDKMYENTATNNEPKNSSQTKRGATEKKKIEILQNK